MPVIENKIADAVLRRIRALNTVPADSEVTSPTESRVEIGKSVSVREAQFSDFERVCALNIRLGQGSDSIQNWQRLWRENPALTDGRGRSPIGWVLEVSQNIVGFLGSIPLQYEFGGSVLRAAATCRFTVELPYRAFSHLLVVSFLRQKNVDLFLNTTATVAAGRIMTALKTSSLPQPDYGKVLFWVLEPHRFSGEVLRKLGVKTPFAGPSATIASLILKADMAIRGRVPRVTSPGYCIRETSVREIGPEFERLSRDYSKEKLGLFARRTAKVMRWHFDPPGNRRTVRVLGSYERNELLGYLIVRHEAPNAEGIRRSLVADLLVKDDDPKVLESLFVAALASAKDSGCDVLELMGFPTRIRQVILRWKPYLRQYPACPFFYKAQERALHEKLAQESAWYACPFDGDATLWP